MNVMQYAEKIGLALLGSEAYNKISQQRDHCISIYMTLVSVDVMEVLIMLKTW